MKPELHSYLKTLLSANPDLVTTSFGDQVDNFLNTAKNAENCSELSRLASILVNKLSARKAGAPVYAVGPAEKGAFAAKLMKLLPTYAGNTSADKSTDRRTRLAGIGDILPHASFTEVLEIYFSKGYTWDYAYPTTFNVLMKPERLDDLRAWIKGAKPLRPLQGESGKTLAGLLVANSTPHVLNLLEFGPPESWPNDVKLNVASDLHSIYKLTVNDMPPTDIRLQAIIACCLPHASPVSKERLAKVAFLHGDLITAEKIDVNFKIEEGDFSRISAGSWGDAGARFVELIDFVSKHVPDLALSPNTGKDLLAKAISIGYEPTLKLFNMGIVSTSDFKDTYSQVLSEDSMSLAQKELLVDLLIDKGVELKTFEFDVPAALRYQRLSGSTAEYTEKLLKLGLGENFKQGYDYLFTAAVKGQTDLVARAKDIVGPNAYITLGYTSSEPVITDLLAQFPQKTSLILAGRACALVSHPPTGLKSSLKSEYWDATIAKVLALKELGADLNTAALLGRDILSSASAAPKKQFVKLLKQGGFSPEAITMLNPTTGSNIMHDVAKNGEIHTLQTMINLGGDIEKKNTSGQTVLAVACANQHMATIQSLATVGADFQTVDDKGDGLLSIALKLGTNSNPDILSYLLDKNVSIASTTKPILQSLVASYQCTEDMLVSALRLGADPNAVCTDGTPVIFGPLQSPRFLSHMVSYGLNIFTQNLDGVSVLDSIELDTAKQLIEVAASRAKAKLELRTPFETSVDAEIELG